MIKNFVIIFTLFTVLNSQDFTVEEIVNRVAITPKPSTSITEVKLEITRFKRNKEKVKVKTAIPDIKILKYSNMK